MKRAKRGRDRKSSPKHSLNLPDLDQAKSAVLNSLPSKESQLTTCCTLSVGGRVFTIPASALSKSDPPVLSKTDPVGISLGRDSP